MARRKQALRPGETRNLVTGVRISPRVAYLTEIAARRMRMTISTYCAWAMERAFAAVELAEGLSLASDTERLWDVDEADRFVKLAILYPQLLNPGEEVVWKCIRDAGIFRGLRRPRTQAQSEWFTILQNNDKAFRVLRKHWQDLLEAIDEGKHMEWIDKMRATMIEESPARIEVQETLENV